MSVADHFGIDERVIKKIGVTPGILMKEYLPFFDPYKDKCSLSKISLMHYIDIKGDFTESKLPSGKVAFAMFNNLDKEGKREVINYLKFAGEGK